jgi:hypothetical protein
MNDNPDEINDPQRQIEASIDKIGERYSASHKRSRTENKERAEIRTKAKELGMRTDAFQVGVRIVKDLTDNERKDFLRDLNLVVSVLGAKQGLLFPDEALKAAAREQRKADKAAGKPRSAAELDAKTDTDPKSDPAAGGAQVDIEEAIAAQTARELAEGEALIEGKSEAWRDGFNAFGAGAARADMPSFVEPDAAQNHDDWLSGYDAASQRAFDAAKPAEVPSPVVTEPGGVFNAGAGKPGKAPKPSQSAKGNAKRAAAGLN